MGGGGPRVHSSRGRARGPLALTAVVCALFAGGCRSRGESPAGEAIGTSAAPLTADAGSDAGHDAGTDAGTASPALGSFGVYATQSILLNANALVTGCNVGVEYATGPYLNGGVAAYLNADSSIATTQTLYAASVYLDVGSTLGPVDTNQLTVSGGSTHGAVSPFPAAMPTVPVPPAATAGTTAVTVNSGTKTLSAGAYGTVLVNGGATLALTGGTYVMSSLTLNGNAALTVSAATTLSITGLAAINGGSSMGPAKGSGLTAKSLVVYSDSAQSVILNGNCSVQAILVATSAEVIINTSNFVGAVAAAQVLLNSDAVVTCQDGLGSIASCSGPCNNGNPCTTGACVSGQCAYTPVANGVSCKDGNACDLSDTCQAGTCTAGSHVTCTAPDSCHTAGTCNATTGVCSAPTLNAGYCDIGNTCVVSGAADGANTCETCQPSVTTSAYTPVANGASCSDGNACDLSDTCQSGVCTAGSHVTCTASDSCHVAGTCSPSTGQCSNPAAANGTTCNDGNSCDLSDTCQSGVCTAGSHVTCTASDQCHVAGTCNSSTGQCSNPAIGDGTACSDGNACSLGDSCRGGVCVPSRSITCAPLDECHTAGTCNPATGACTNPQLADGTTCDTGNPCTTGACELGACSATPVSVGTTCQGTGQCNAAGYCVFNGLDAGTEAGSDSGLDASDAAADANDAAEDAPAEAAPDAAPDATPPTCAAGCSDGNPCTVNTCNPDGTCSNAAVTDGTACDDGNLCSLGDVCVAGVCTGAPAPGTPCASSGDPCVVSVCTAQSSCISQPATSLHPGPPCTVAQCDPVNGITYPPLPGGSPCGDSTDLCLGAFACDGSGNCVQGPPPQIDDGNPCTYDSCDPVAGVTHVPVSAGSTCGSPSNVCAGTFACDGYGNCTQSGAPASTACEIVTCDPTNGVVQAPAAAGTPCGNDSNPCLNPSTCDAVGNCPSNPVAAGTTCGTTSNPCSTLLTCNAAAQCVQVPAPPLNDGNPCTTDTCDPVNGVTHAPVPTGTPCGDNSNLCVGTSACDGAGSCVQGPAPVVNDGNACTVNTCSPSAGVTHTLLPLGTSCAENTNLCVGAFTCAAVSPCGQEADGGVSEDGGTSEDGGGCASAPASGEACVQQAGPTIDDGDPCTVESCDPATGLVSSTPITSTNPCVLLACDPVTGIQTAPAPQGSACKETAPVVVASVGAQTSGGSFAGDCSEAYTCDGAGNCAGSAIPADGALCGPDRNLCAVHGQCSARACVEVPPTITTVTVVNAPAPYTPPQTESGNGPFFPCQTTSACDPLTGTVTVGNTPSLVPVTITNGPYTNTFNYQASCIQPDCSVGTCDGLGNCQGGYAPPFETLCGTLNCSQSSNGDVNVSVTPLPAGTSCYGNYRGPCQVNYLCDGNLNCDYIAAPVIDQSNPCLAGSCDESTGVVSYTPVSAGVICAGSNLCDGASTCNGAGACVVNPLPSLATGNPCTVASCNPATGIVTQTPLPAGANCGTDPDLCDGNPILTCNASGVCVTHPGAVLTPANPCLEALCNPATGAVTNLPMIGAPCGSGNACTGASACDGTGACVAGPAPSIDDGNACTTDTCNPTTGPTHTVTPGAPCGSNTNACAGAFTCTAQGACVEGRSTPLDDGNPCTLDSCNSATGQVTHQPIAGCTPPLWATVGGRPSPRDSAATAFDPTSGSLILFGGENSGVPLSDTWVWSQSSHLWTASYRAGPPARAGAASAFDSARRKLIVFGGIARRAEADTYLADTWEYDIASSTWLNRTPATAGPSARAYAAAAYDPTRGSFVLIGGRGASGAADAGQAWEWDGLAGAWSVLTTSGTPAPRDTAAMAYDPVTSSLVLFGGELTSNTTSTPPIAETWELPSSSAAWSLRAPPTSPPARVGHAMAFDPSQQKVLLFGGTGVDAGTLADTWIYDGQAGAWTETSTSTAPPARAGHALVYNPSSQRSIALGGVWYSPSGRTTPDLDDVWEFNALASSWSPLTSLAPGTSVPGAVFDPVANRVNLRGNEQHPAMWELDTGTGAMTPSDALAGQSDYGQALLGAGTYLSAYALNYNTGRSKLLLTPAVIYNAGTALWEWNRSQWAARSCPNAPIGLQPVASAFDVANNNLTVLGWNPNQGNVVQTWIVSTASCVWTQVRKVGLSPPNGSRNVCGVRFEARRYPPLRSVWFLVVQSSVERLDLEWCVADVGAARRSVLAAAAAILHPRLRCVARSLRALWRPSAEWYAAAERYVGVERERSDVGAGVDARGPKRPHQPVAGLRPGP